jgi:hypothetical protein
MHFGYFRFRASQGRFNINYHRRKNDVHQLTNLQEFDAIVDIVY